MNKPAIRFEQLLRRLDELFRLALRVTRSPYREIFLSLIVVKLHDQWNFRSRQIILFSYKKSEKAMLEYLRKNWKTPRGVMDNSWEPYWHIPRESIRAGTILRIGNLSKVQDSFGAVMCVDELRWTRNAIVHNNPKAFGKYRETILNQYKLKNIPPHEIITYRNPKTGNTIYEDWSHELLLALSAAI